MRKIIFLVLSAVGFFVWAGVVKSEPVERDSVADCHLSFLAPSGLEYIELEGAIVLGKDECYLPFKYTGAMRSKLPGRIPSMPEDWRAMTDFSLTVEGIPLWENLNKIESNEGEGGGLFKLIAKEHALLPGGDLYVLKYVAAAPTASMVKLRETRRLILVAGNDFRSVSYYLYSGGKLSAMEARREKAMRDLFASFHFD